MKSNWIQHLKAHFTHGLSNRRLLASLVQRQSIGAGIT